MRARDETTRTGTPEPTTRTSKPRPIGKNVSSPPETRALRNEHNEGEFDEDDNANSQPG